MKALSQKDKIFDLVVPCDSEQMAQQSSTHFITELTPVLSHLCCKKDAGWLDSARNLQLHTIT
jgi:hypothetical protein